MEGRVEQEHEAAVGLVPPHRVVAEEDDVALSERHVDDRGRPRELGAAREHAADPEVFLVRPADDHARPHPCGEDRAGEVLAHLGLDMELALGGLEGRLALELAERATLRNVGVGRRAAAGRPRGALAAGPSGSAPATAAAGQRDAEDRGLVEVERNRVVVAVGDRAPFVLHRRAKDRPMGLKLARLGDRDVLDHAEPHGQTGARGDRDEDAAVLHERLQVGQPFETQAAADIVRVVDTARGSGSARWT